jgi:hypothetical protein
MHSNFSSVFSRTQTASIINPKISSATSDKPVARLDFKLYTFMRNN